MPTVRTSAPATGLPVPFSRTTPEIGLHGGDEIERAAVAHDPNVRPARVAQLAGRRWRGAAGDDLGLRLDDGRPPHVEVVQPVAAQPADREPAGRVGRRLFAAGVVGHKLRVQVAVFVGRVERHRLPGLAVLGGANRRGQRDAGDWLALRVDHPARDDFLGRQPDGEVRPHFGLVREHGHRAVPGGERPDRNAPVPLGRNILHRNDEAKCPVGAARRHRHELVDARPHGIDEDLGVGQRLTSRVEDTAGEDELLDRRRRRRGFGRGRRHVV
ncbi:MAG: hypothetical protein U0746_04310 [Gemmataceae bacterium]